MLRHVTVVALTMGVVIGLASACSGGGKGCATLCSEAQAGSCTAVKGNCTNFCAAANTVKGPAGCGTQYDSYQTCLNAKPRVCDTACNSQENAFTQCMTAYCLKNIGDKDCVTLASSF